MVMMSDEYSEALAYAKRKQDAEKATVKLAFLKAVSYLKSKYIYSYGGDVNASTALDIQKLVEEFLSEYVKLQTEKGTFGRHSEKWLNIFTETFVVIIFAINDVMVKTYPFCQWNDSYLLAETIADLNEKD